MRYIDKNDFLLSFHIDKVCQTYMNTEFGDKIFTLACAPEFVSSNLHQIGNRIKYLLFFKCFFNKYDIIGKHPQSFTDTIAFRYILSIGMFHGIFKVQYVQPML